MSWLLDTDTCIYALKQRPAVLGALLAKAPSRIHLSVITEGELRFGAAQSEHQHRTLAKLEAFLAPLQILPFMPEDAAVYAQLRAGLQKSGKPIGALDMLIAGHALSRDLVLVTNNRREFSRVPGLKLENWAQ